MVIWRNHVHRALKASWFDSDGLLTNKAYRRSPKDTDGLSVACSHDYAKKTLERGSGVAAILIDALTDLGLKASFAPDDPHGTIDGLPPDGLDYNRASELADRLVAVSELTLEKWNNKKA
jgi:hypothetical protein